MVYTAGSKRLLLVLLSAMLLLFLLTSSACVCIVEPANYLYVENRTDQTLGFFIDESCQGDALPGEITKITTMDISHVDIYSADTKFLIEAKIKTGEAGLYGVYGEVVYSEEFTWQELDDMDWKIVIPPPSTS